MTVTTVMTVMNKNIHKNIQSFLDTLNMFEISLALNSKIWNGNNWFNRVDLQRPAFSVGGLYPQPMCRRHGTMVRHAET